MGHFSDKNPSFWFLSLTNPDPHATQPSSPPSIPCPEICIRKGAWCQMRGALGGNTGVRGLISLDPACAANTTIHPIKEKHVQENDIYEKTCLNVKFNFIFGLMPMVGGKHQCPQLLSYPLSALPRAPVQHVTWHCQHILCPAAPSVSSSSEAFKSLLPALNVFSIFAANTHMLYMYKHHML